VPLLYVSIYKYHLIQTWNTCYNTMKHGLKHKTVLKLYPAPFLLAYFPPQYGK